jgi:hypothetical protein
MPGEKKRKRKARQLEAQFEKKVRCLGLNSCYINVIDE